MTQDIKLTHGSIKNHLIRLSIPASMGMLFDTLYNLTDNWFAGMISDDALVGLSIASIVFLLLIAIAIGLQSGMSAMIAPDFAKKRQSEMSSWIANGIGIGCLMSVIIIIIGINFAGHLMDILSQDTTAKSEAWDYLLIIIMGNIAYAISSVCAGALIAMGNTVVYRNVLIAGFFGNLILNPLLTFYFNMGIKGLALATVIIKVLSALYLFNALKNKTGTFHWPQFNMARWVICLKQIMPASMNFLTIIIGAFIIVAFIGRFGSEAVAGYSVALRIEQVLLLPALGLSSAVMAIVGQNFGTHAYDRIHETLSGTLKIGFVLSCVFIPIMVFGGPLLMGLFTDNPDIIATGTLYLRADAVAFFGYVMIFACVAVLQAVKKPNFPLVVGILRQLILPIIVNYILIVQLGYDLPYLFWSVVAIVIVSALLMYWYTKRQLAQLTNNQANNSSET
ncbi:MAG: MATE family efflux transporter [Marinicellaceae bacterium]